MDPARRVPLERHGRQEGFRVVGCASDEVELDRILQQDVDPDVVVLDTEISIASVAVARERAPAAHVIVVWPDAVLAPTGTERTSPWLVYELLGPSIRARTRRPKPSLEASAAPEHPLAYAETLVETDAPRPTGRRVASRLTLTSVLLAALIVATMGAAFALDSLHISPALNLLRRGASSPPIAATHTSAPSPGVSHPTPILTLEDASLRRQPRARDPQRPRVEPGARPSGVPNASPRTRSRALGTSQPRSSRARKASRPRTRPPSHGNGEFQLVGGSSQRERRLCGELGGQSKGLFNGNGGSQGTVDAQFEHPHGPPADKLLDTPTLSAWRRAWRARGHCDTA